MNGKSGQRTILLLTVLTTGGVLLSGCLIGEEVEEPGMMAFYVKDQPAALASLEVTFFDVRAVTAANLESPETNETSESERNATMPVGGAEFETVGDEVTRVDLLAYQGEEEARRVTQGEVAPGTYSHLVFQIGGGEAGFGGTLGAPVEIVRDHMVLSGNFTVEEGELLQILADFDLERSLTVESENETVTVVFDPVLADVQVASGPITPAARLDFQFGEAESMETGVVLASDVRIERGALMLTEPVLKQESAVDATMRIDTDGDGTVDETVRTVDDLRNVIGTPQQEPTPAPNGTRAPSPSPTGDGIGIRLPTPTTPIGIGNRTV